LTDSLKLPVPGWRQGKKENLKIGTLDSLQQRGVQLGERVTSKTQVTLPPGLESLKATALTKQLDSLRTIKSPDTLVSKYLIGMTAKSDSLQSLLKLPPQTEEAARLQQRARDELNKMPAKVNEKLKLFSEQGANVGQLSGFSFPGSMNSGLPGVDPNLPGTGIFPGLTGIAGPSAFIPSASGGLSIPGANIPSANIPQVGLPVPDSKSISVPSLPDVKTSVPEIGDVKGEMGIVNGAMKEAQGYKKDIKAITAGNLDSLDAESIEKQVEQLDLVADASDQLLDGAQQAAMIKKWQSDPAYKREMAVTQAKEFSVNHFAGHEKELMAVMDKLASAKAKVKDAEQVVDLFGKPANPMKDKPTIERLRPGLNLQLQWSQIVLLDFNPYVGYRFSSKWMAGLGWNERIGFSSDSYKFSQKDRVSGVRGFVQYKFKGSNHLILSPELMNTEVPAETVPAGASTRRWVPGLMAGYKREFRYSAKVIGTVQFLYNLVAPNGQSPYADRINLMFGFEFPLKKKV
jgi:hypothetical protein